VLEIVLGIDNIILLIVLVDRLPERQRARARFLGSGFAMLTRIALLLSLVWVTTLVKPLFTAWGVTVSLRDAVLFAGGALLIVQSIREILEMMRGGHTERETRAARGFWLIIIEIGVLDIVFSLDSVFTAIGLAKRTEVMVAAIVVSVIAMIWISSAVGRFIDRYPSIRALALAFLVLVGAALVAESLHLEIPQAYLYFALAFSGVVEWINIRLRRRG
jgi:predicted tellurium resistance membrane protein TerC